MMDSPVVGFWRRLVAEIIDSALFAGLEFGIWLALLFSEISMLNSLIIALGINFTIGFVYEVVLTSRYGGPVGKIVMRCRVTDEKGGNISLKTSFGRSWAKVLSCIILGIGFLMIAWDPKKQGLHDKLAHTYVVDHQTSRVPKKVKTGVTALVVIGVVVYGVLWITTLAMLFLSGMNAMFHPLDQADVFTSLEKECGATPSWQRDYCYIGYIQLTPTFWSFSRDQKQDICSRIASPDLQLICVQISAMVEQDQNICTWLSSPIHERSCTKNVALGISVSKLITTQPNYEFSGNLDVGRFIVGFGLPERVCMEKETTTFNPGDAICFAVHNVSGFVLGADDLYDYSVNLVVRDGWRKIIASGNDIDGTGKVFLKDGILSFDLATWSTADNITGNATYEYTIIDNVGKKGMNRTGKMVFGYPPQESLTVQKAVVGFYNGFDCESAPNLTFSSKDILCASPVVSGFEGLKSIYRTGKTIAYNVAVKIRSPDGTLLYHDPSARNGTVKGSALLGRLVFASLYELQPGTYATEIIITDAVSGRNVSIPQEITVANITPRALIPEENVVYYYILTGNSSTYTINNKSYTLTLQTVQKEPAQATLTINNETFVLAEQATRILKDGAEFHIGDVIADFIDPAENGIQFSLVSR